MSVQRSVSLPSAHEDSRALSLSAIPFPFERQHEWGTAQLKRARFVAPAEHIRHFTLSVMDYDSSSNPKYAVSASKRALFSIIMGSSCNNPSEREPK